MKLAGSAIYNKKRMDSIQYPASHHIIVRAPKPRASSEIAVGAQRASLWHPVLTQTWLAVDETERTRQ